MPTVAVAADVADDDPATFLAVTRARKRCERSAERTTYVADVAPAIALQLFPAAVARQPLVGVRDRLRAGPRALARRERGPDPSSTADRRQHGVRRLDGGDLREYVAV